DYGSMDQDRDADAPGRRLERTPRRNRGKRPVPRERTATALLNLKRVGIKFDCYLFPREKEVITSAAAANGIRRAPLPIICSPAPRRDRRVHPPMQHHHNACYRVLNAPAALR